MVEVSPTFAQMWASRDVAAPGRRVKVYRNADIGTINLMSSSLSIDGSAEQRIVVYTPVADADRDQLDRLRAIADPTVGCALHGKPLSTLATRTPRP
jgi:hypothetical protein